MGTHRFLNAPRPHGGGGGGTAGARTQRRWGSETQALTGSGATVGSILGGSATLNAVQVTDHSSTDADLTGDGLTLTTADSVRSGLTVATLNRTHSSAATVLGVTLHGLTLTGTTGTEALDGDFLTSGVKVGSDSGEVGEGSVHRVVFLSTLIRYIRTGVCAEMVDSPPTVLSTPEPGGQRRKPERRPYPVAT